MEATVQQDDGQVSVLLIGMVAIALTLVMGVVAVTSVQLSRIQLMDAADAAALDAADAIAEEVAYREGVGRGVPLSAEEVTRAASAHLASRPLPSRVTSWRLTGDTGTPDGRTAVVQLSGAVRIPVLSAAVDQFGGGVTITVRSAARSDLG
jgi:Putative Flp pilus-assembly TadE/G-like